MSADDYNRWRIALYYCYIELPDVQRHVDFQRTACGELHLTGRIRVAPEGINGTIAGSPAGIDASNRSTLSHQLGLLSTFHSLPPLPRSLNGVQF